MILPSLHIKWERWKYNKNFEVYVSNMGHIRNSSKALLAPKINNSGYCKVRVGGSKQQYILVHRLVMLTWRPTPEAEYLTVDHLDHNKRNNALENLEWVTREENMRRAEEDFLCEKENITAISFTRGTETFIIHKNNKNDLKTFENKYLGKVQNLSRKNINKILTKFWNGNVKAKKEYGFYIEAIYE